MFLHIKNKLPGLDEYWNKYLMLQKRTELPAKTILLLEGKISKKYFYIEKGCVRVWFNNNGKEILF